MIIKKLIELVEMESEEILGPQFSVHWSTCTPIPGKRFPVSHGNSLQALVKHLYNISDDGVIKLTIPDGIPLVYELGENLKPTKVTILPDPKGVRKAVEAVARQEGRRADTLDNTRWGDIKAHLHRQ